MFASRKTETVQTPSSPSYQVTIRRLSGRQLERAQQQTMVAGVELMRQLGGVAIAKEIVDLGGEQAVRQQVDRNQAQRYDRLTVLKAGITAWDAPEPLSESAIDDLEEPTAAFLFQEILRVSDVVVTAQQAEEREVALKND